MDRERFPPKDPEGSRPGFVLAGRAAQWRGRIRPQNRLIARRTKVANDLLDDVYRIAVEHMSNVGVAAALAVAWAGRARTLNIA